MRILICDDHEVVRSGLRRILESRPGFEVVGEATSSRDSIKKAEELRPDVVILDLSMPDGSSLAAIGVLRQALPETKVLVLTMHEDEAYFFAALQAGASGYILKGESAGELTAALDLIAEGGVPIPRVLGRRIAADYLSRGSDPAALSSRERQMLKLIAAGRTNKEIAAELALSVRTVERHRSAIMTKLGFENKAELLRYAIEHGWPDPAM